jgi:hypothetical protein
MGRVATKNQYIGVSLYVIALGQHRCEDTSTSRARVAKPARGDGKARVTLAACAKLGAFAG